MPKPLGRYAFASAAFVLPEHADVRAILFALADLDTNAAVSAQLERFPTWTALWVVAEGYDAVDAITQAQQLLPTFGLTFTEC
jgi:hypothetical protein